MEFRNSEFGIPNSGIIDSKCSCFWLTAGSLSLFLRILPTPGRREATQNEAKPHRIGMEAIFSHHMCAPSAAAGSAQQPVTDQAKVGAKSVLASPLLSRSQPLGSPKNQNALTLSDTEMHTIWAVCVPRIGRSYWLLHR